MEEFVSTKVILSFFFWVRNSVQGRFWIEHVNLVLPSLFGCLFCFNLRPAEISLYDVPCRKRDRIFVFWACANKLEMRAGKIKLRYLFLLGSHWGIPFLSPKPLFREQVRTERGAVLKATFDFPAKKSGAVRD